MSSQQEQSAPSPRLEAVIQVSNGHRVFIYFMCLEIKGELRLVASVLVSWSRIELVTNISDECDTCTYLYCEKIMGQLNRNPSLVIICRKLTIYISPEPHSISNLHTLGLFTSVM